MKQILQDLSNGKTFIIESPIPKVSKNSLLIQTSKSLISAGTERMLVEFGKASYLQKAKKQPEKVRMVLDKIKTDGLKTTFDAVKAKLDQPLPLGYCNVGVVVEVGEQVEGFKVGDRVVSNGPHADFVKVSKNLCAKIPENVDSEQAVFTVLASIGLQGIRLAQPTLGETFVVTGVGLIGLLVIQLLKAQGCQVLALDYDEKKLHLASQFGAQTFNLASGENPYHYSQLLTNNRGVDGVIICASTQSSDPVTQAAQMCRQRGRVILVGVSGLNLNRADFYEKEISFQVSCSYGPGRYAEEYEQKGLDYPFGLVRWTEQRNFEAVLDLMSQNVLNIEQLISHRYLFDELLCAYDALIDDASVLGIILDYPQAAPSSSLQNSMTLHETFTSYEPNAPKIGLIGSGNYASRMLIPEFKIQKTNLHTIVSSNVVAASIIGRRAGFSKVSNDVHEIFNDEVCNTVVIATRHDSHAELTMKALKAGKHVFVEKPLALTFNELNDIEKTYRELKKPVHLVVGYNRRFSPHIQKIKSLLQPIASPKSFIFTINAGYIPNDHWTQDLLKGGGRIIGEACHFIDLIRYLVGHPVTKIQTQALGKNLGHDNVSITLGFEDGSFGTILYLSNGAKNFPKERIEVFAEGRILKLDNFLKLSGFGFKNFKKMNLWNQDKGQSAFIKYFLESIREGKESIIPIGEIFEVARVTLDVAALLKVKS